MSVAPFLVLAAGFAAAVAARVVEARTGEVVVTAIDAPYEGIFDLRCT